MQISAKGGYATRAVLDLALQRERGLTPIQEIAARQGIPQRYLEQVLLALKRAGLLGSKRGSTGGYHLTRPADAITVGDVPRAGEGGGAPVSGQRRGGARRAGGGAPAGRDDRRAHERQHRDRPGDGGRGQGLPPDPDDAGRHERRAPAAARPPRRRAPAAARRRGHERGGVRGGGAGARAPRVLHAAAVPEPGEPRRAPAHDRARDPGGRRRPAPRRRRRRRGGGGGPGGRGGGRGGGGGGGGG